MASTRGALWRHGDFRRLWAAQAVSAFGSRITRTALPVIAILLITADPVEIAILSSLEVIPGILAGLFAGGFVDRHDKRPILVSADLARALLVFSIPFAAWFAELTMAQLYIIAALVGACSALFRLADNAYLPALIGREHLVEGNSRLETTDSLAEIGGPGLAGVLIQLLTAPIAMAVDALSYLWSAALLARIGARECSEARAPGARSVSGDIRIGFRAGFGHPVVGPTFWSFALSDLFNGFFLALYSLYALKTLGIGVAALGVIISLGGVSALAGAFVASSLSRRMGLGPALIATLGAGKVANLFVAVAGVVPGLGALFLSLGQLLGDGCMVAFLILANSYRQAVLPQGVIARASGTLQVLTGVLLPLGALVAGMLASATSVAVAIQVGMAGGLLALVPLLRAPIYRLRAET